MLNAVMRVYRAAPRMCRATVSLLVLAGLSPLARGGEPVVVTLQAVKDNTLIQPLGEDIRSNGAGPAFFVGRVGAFGSGTLRRGVIAFDLSNEVPAGATITAVSLQLHMQQTVSGNQSVSLHRLLHDWGEGTSFSLGGQGAPAAEGDATWFHSFFPDAFWDSNGGDFAPTASATRTVGGIGFYTWGSTTQLVADVQGWIDDPSTNFGWIVIGNEAVLQTAKKFDSREGASPDQRPALSVTYIPSAGSPADLNEDGVVDIFDLLILLGEWGDCPDCPANLNGDDVVNVFDLLILLAEWG